jgi:hypothetical protein
MLGAGFPVAVATQVQILVASYEIPGRQRGSDEGYPLRRVLEQGRSGYYGYALLMN